MKKSNIVLALALSCLGVACTKENTPVVPEYEMEPMSFSTIETKTVLSGQEVHWTAGDKVTVYSNIAYSIANTFTSSDIAGKDASFSGEVPVGTESFYAVYPEAKSVDANSVTISIPEVQNATVGTFAEELNFAIAKGTKTPGVPEATLSTFENVCSYIKFTVPSYVKNVTSVSISSDDALAGDYKVGYGVESGVVEGVNSVSMTPGLSGNNAFMFVIAPGVKKNIVITVEADDVTWTRSVASVTASVNKPLNFGVLDFKPTMSIKAEHYNNAAGELAGTNVILGSISVPNGLGSTVTDATITVTNAGGDVVRSAGVTADSKDLNLVAVDGWPYLPQGKYTATLSYTLGGSEKTTSTQFTVPAPVFDVKSFGDCTYDYYTRNEVNYANQFDALSVRNVWAKAAISDELLNNSNYSKGGYKYKIGADGAESADNVLYAPSWGEHKLYAAFTFAGTTCWGSDTASKTCHITGLPYRAPSEHKFNQSGYAWTKISGGGTSINADYIDLKPTDAPAAKSPMFSVPANKNINIQVNSKYTKNVTSYISSYTYSVKLSEKTDIITHEYNKKGTYDHTGNSTFTTADNYISCHYSYRAMGNDVTVNSIEILYR